MESRKIIMMTMDVLMYVCMFVLMQIIGGSLQYVGAKPEISIVFSYVLIIGLFLLTKWSKPNFRKIKDHTTGSWLWTFLLGLALVLPASLASDAMNLEMPEAQEIMMLEMMKTPLGVISVVLLAPFVEELVFRGAILRRMQDLKNWNGWLAIALSALIFAIIHFNLPQGIHAFAVGLLMGWLFLKTGSILLGMVIHLVNNMAAYAFYAFSGNPEITLKEMFGGNNALMYASVAVSVLVAVFCLYRLATNKLTK